MIRVLFYLAIIFVLALGGAWVAERPGIVTLDWEGYRIQASLMISLIALLAVVVVCIVVWGIFRFIVHSPGMTSRYFKRRRKDRGFDALSRGLLALGAGDSNRARKFGMEADKLLKGNEPAAKLLLAQSAQMSGNSEESRKRFEAMLEDNRSRAVGLHGLFIEAEREQEPEAARHFAEQASEMVPGLKWAGRAVLGYQAVSGDWDAAIKSLERNYSAKMIDKKTYRRHKAVLLTARALELENQSPDQARPMAKEAHGLAPDLVPAALVAARLFSRRGDYRKASKMLEATWKLSQHPDIPEAYSHVRPGDSALDRLNRVKHLASLRSHSTEGALALAEAAMNSKEFDLARDKLKSVLRSEPSQRAFLMMADLEEAEHGDEGRVREWLSRAVRAPHDKVWYADGVVSAHWAPVSPKTGRLDAYEWRVPEGEEVKGEQIEAIDDSLFEPPVLAAPAAPAAPVAEKPEAKVAEDVLDLTPAEKVEETEVKQPVVEQPEVKQEEAKVEAKGAATEKPVAPVAPVEAVAEVAESAAEKAPEETKEPTAEAADKPAAEDEAKLSEAEAKDEQTSEVKPEEAKAEKEEDAEAGKEDNLVKFPMSHLPDDPGPEPEGKDSKDDGYRFFR
ncbi:heme biosynthesis protein HemY [Rhodobacteraceae bacterium RKSG542]|uniref:heme biosynthesis protein HemY n=1 Tax=Pseudovibrio flavus TaxID=2529854 RepID=UPI0012BB9C42|nr:heme biosynthesis HemY N-terminal domain-containing protein [Pseudovibrio flavus]MTI16825.1 heme biosynthesis protein HemY [Pseudovibrio flavus]